MHIEKKNQSSKKKVELVVEKHPMVLSLTAKKIAKRSKLMLAGVRLVYIIMNKILGLLAFSFKLLGGKS